MKIKENARRYAAAKSSAKAEPPTRITVRLKPELAQQVDAARRARKVSATAVIEQALNEHLARAEPVSKLSVLDAFRKHRLLGAVDLGAGNAADHEAEVTQYLADKHGSGHGSKHGPR